MDAELDVLTSRMLYRLLQLGGFPAPAIGQPDMPSIAWPDSQVGIVAPGEAEREGWITVRLDPKELVVFGSLLARTAILNLDRQLRTPATQARRRTSKEEDLLLQVLVSLGVGVPNRNYDIRDDDGRYRGTLDFAWEEVDGVGVKVAVEVDGWYWHVGKDLARDIAAMAAIDPKVNKSVVHHERKRGEVDKAKRRILQERGWQVVVVQDTEITPARVDALAAQIGKVLAIAAQRPGGSLDARPAVPVPELGEAG